MGEQSWEGKDQILCRCDRSGGFQYFWIDTCCIDKWNIQELSRSINSMFQWYRDAQKCYVFLSDVSLSCEADAAQPLNWEASFRNSQWFSRGWTLQELIAPTTVEFFSCEGFYLGDKTSLEQIIHDITRILQEVLQGCPLKDFGIEERMDWAKHRKTQEPEDNAYCLLGLLNVQMTLSYGEGAETAFRRLQAELKPSNTVAFIVPFSQNSYSIGRECELAELDKVIFRDKSSTLLAIAMASTKGTVRHFAASLRTIQEAHHLVTRIAFFGDSRA